MSFGVGRPLYQAVQAAKEPVDHEQQTIDLRMELEAAKRRIAALEADLREALIAATKAERNIIETKGTTAFRLHAANGDLREEIAALRAENTKLRVRESERNTRAVLRAIKRDVGDWVRRTLDDRGFD